MYLRIIVRARQQPGDGSLVVFAICDEEDLKGLAHYGVQPMFSACRKAPAEPPIFACSIMMA